MNQAASVENFQVCLTGRRLNPVSDQEVNRRLQQQFSITEDQAAQLLIGPVIVKQSLELRFAAKVASALRACGLEAVVEAMDGMELPAAPAPQPAPAGAPRRSATASTADPLAALGAQRMPTIDPTPEERRRRLILAACCAAIPLSYLGITAAVAIAWLQQLLALPQALGAGAIVGPLLLALLGGALLLLLLKPLLAGRAAAAGAPQISIADEPELLRSVEVLSLALDMPAPVEIRLDSGVGASLRLRDGWRGLRGGPTALTIGMPLIAGLSARELMGVLAHALGHGARREDLRCWLLINGSNAWLDRAANAPDAWDERLEQWLEQPANAAQKVFAQAAAPGIRLLRLLMGVLFRLSRALSQRLSRQLEFEADRYEAWVAGSRQFRLTARNLRALEQASDEVAATNLDGWQDGRLLKNIPAAIGARFRAMGSEALRAIDADLAQAVTRYWDAHPADSERIVRAEEDKAPGLYLNEQPAVLLLRQYEHWGEQLTAETYARQGLSYSPDQLISANKGAAGREAREGQSDALDRYFNGQFRPWPLLNLRVPTDPELLEAGWQGTIDHLRRRSPEMTHDWETAAELEVRRPALLLAASLGLKPSQFGVSGLDHLPREQLWRTLENIRLRQHEAHEQLASDLQLHALRIDCAIRALPETARAKAETLRRLLLGLNEFEIDVTALAELQSASGILQRIHAAGGHPDAAKDRSEALRLFVGHAHRLLENGKAVAQTVLEGGTVSGYLLARCPQAGSEQMGDAERYLRNAAGLPEAFQQLYLRALGELVALCELAEQAERIRPIRRIVLALDNFAQA